MSLAETTAPVAGASADAAAAGAVSLAPAKPMWRRHLSALAHRPTAVVSAVFLLLLALMAIFAPWLAPHDPLEQNPAAILQPPFWADGGSTEYLLGTDELGRDLLSRLMVGARTALGLGVAATLVTALVGIVLGLMAGMSTRFVGPAIMWIADAQLAFPYIVLALAVIAARGTSLFNLFVVLSIFGWVQFARVVRAEVLRVKTADYVLAARGCGTSTPKIVLRHILPNVASPTIVTATFTFAAMVLVESGLSFLGVGVQPPTPDWGALMASGRVYLYQSAWYSLLPGLLIFFTILAVNVLGLAVRDVLNPKGRR